MSLSQSVKESNGVHSSPNATHVRQQLDRLLSHPLFTNSKRYPVLLAYTVEQALLGNAGDLKERTIGVEAFGREPNYDVNLDPVVRTTAAEVRKRLIQYYYSPDHAGELIIEMPVGSYAPVFRELAFHPPAKADTEEMAGQIASTFRGPDVSEVPPVDPKIAPDRRSAFRWIPITAGFLFAVLIGFGSGRVGIREKTALPAEPSSTALFWQPITATSSRITYCLGVPTDAVDLRNWTIPLAERGTLNVYDVTTLARSIAPLVPKNGQFRVLAASTAGFAQLREGPFVLIGAFDNPWAMRITQDLPIGFEYDNQVRRVVDRKSTPKGIWTEKWQVPYTSLARDYAIVARIQDKVTGQPVIILAGILGEGTEAASELVSNPTYLDAMLRKAPKNWDQMNLEAVIEADVIEGRPGPPTVVAVETW